MRGSTPCSCDANRRYGGNTSCVAIESPDAAPILLDLGTGLRFFGLTQPRDGTFRGTALVSHLHWDHIQGIPFFAPMLAPGARLDVYAPEQVGRPLEDVVRGGFTFSDESIQAIAHAVQRRAFWGDLALWVIAITFVFYVFG